MRARARKHDWRFQDDQAYLYAEWMRNAAAEASNEQQHNNQQNQQQDEGHHLAKLGAEGSQPSHAGCFVRNGNKMLAVKLTYDGNFWDIPGGRTDGHEPATKTAERETWEESGYPVEVEELLATVRGGFRIFRHGHGTAKTTGLSSRTKMQ